MRRTVVSILALAALLPVAACNTITGSGVMATETRELAEFDKVEFSISGDFTITIGERTPLALEGDDNILPLIKTEVIERRLVVSTDASFRTNRKLTLTVSVPSLQAATLRGSGGMRVGCLDEKRFAADITGSGDLIVSGKADELSAHLSGSGDLQLLRLQTNNLSAKIDGSGDLMATGSIGELAATLAGSGDIRIGGLKAKRISVEVNGSGDVRLTGTSDDFKATVQGTGDVYALGLQTRKADCSVFGSGSIKTAVRETLDASVFGSGNVHYAGNPKVNQSIAGSGNVRQVAERPA